MTALRRLATACLLLLAATLAGVAASAVWFARAAPPPAPGAVIVVLGGAVEDGGRIDASTRARVAAGVALWQAGLAPRLHFTGAAPGRRGAGTQMRDLAESLGVPAAAMSVEDRSRSTLQNALFSRPLLGPLAGERVILVTDGFHLARAWASFRWAGYPQVGLAAASAFGQPPLPEQAWRTCRETLAWWFNLARVAAWEAARAVSGGDALPIGVLR